ncbi:MAG: T9SS type A sorting domain-containing protein, partial [Flavobacteriales bacterium]
AGCDSVVTLDLTINQPDATTDVITACGSYEWINGTTYTSDNNSAQVTLTNQAGCDSVVTLDLTINQPDATTDVITACGSYEWINGTTYTSNNNSAQVTLTNQAGCDSVVTLDLTINQPDATTDVISACESFEWINGTTYTSSNNSAQVTLTNQAGCDSVVTLDLTITQPDATTDVITACSSYEWIDGTTYTSDNNTAQVTLTNLAGCDSVVTLDLTINQPDATTDVITACDSYEWIDGTTYTSDNNTAQVTLTNQAGCDSVVTLDLTINSVGITSVMSTGNTISATNSGATFQWVDCDDNFAPIAGETGNSFTPASTGNYAVEVTNNGCTEITNCVSVMITSLNDQSLNERVSIYPQPSNGELSVNLGGLENVNLSVYGSNGQLVHQMANIQQSVYTMNLNQPAGLYVMLLEAEGNTARFKIVLK